jgi:flagellar biosynthesis protein FliP
MKQILTGLVLVTLAGCGSAQGYHQWLDNRQRTFERQQAVLEAQNQVRVAQLQVQVAQQQAQVNIQIAEGKAKAQEIQTRSLKPIFVMQELVDAIAAGKVQTLVLPSSAMLPLDLGKAVGVQQ